MTSLKKAKLFLSTLVHPGVDPKASNEELMAIIQENQDVKAFELLYERYKRAIFNYCFQLLRSEKEAEEMTQEVFLKLYRFSDSYKNEYSFTTWLWRMARNSCIDQLRKKDPLKNVNIASSHEHELNSIENISDHTPEIDELLFKKAQKNMLQTCMELLPEKQKEAIGLRLYSELGHQEIAETLKTSVSAIKSLLNRAKNNLEKCLRNKMEGEI
jgi:RNA polymerase sigma-70 factor, ECF subfamily